MTDKLYLITEAQRDLLLANHLMLKHETDVLQSLPMVSGEPAAYMFRTDEYFEIGGLAPLPSKRDLLEIAEQGATVIHLYTSPQALTPITADDVTEAIRQEFLTKDVLDEAIATVFNFIVKHRSEAK
jgi:hypothetical protein